MRIVFLGTPVSAVPSLRALIDAGHDVPLVVTQPDRPRGRSSHLIAPPVKVFAAAQGIESMQPTRVRTPEFPKLLAERAPELLVVVAYGRILTAAVLAVAQNGAINLHFSLLPRYRGAAPVQWAIANGECTTGVTTMRMNERLDEGDILLQQELAIGPEEHAPELQARLAQAGAELLIRTIDSLSRAALASRAQDSSSATYAPRLTGGDGRIDPVLPAALIARKIRGFDPWPGVWMRCRGKNLRLVAATVFDGRTAAAPGEIVAASADGLVVAAGESTALLVRRLQFEGRRVVDGQDAIHGRQLEIGDRLAAIAQQP